MDEMHHVQTLAGPAARLAAAAAAAAATTGSGGSNHGQPRNLCAKLELGEGI